MDKAARDGALWALARSAAKPVAAARAAHAAARAAPHSAQHPAVVDLMHRVMLPIRHAGMSVFRRALRERSSHSLTGSPVPQPLLSRSWLPA